MKHSKIIIILLIVLLVESSLNSCWRSAIDNSEKMELQLDPVTFKNHKNWK